MASNSLTVCTTFVVPVRNDAAALSRCLRSIRRQESDSAHVRIIVADNGSTDGSAAAAREQGAQVLELPGLKVGELRNRAATEASGDVLAFVDADHELGPGWIGAAVKALGQAQVAAVGFPYSAPANGTWVQRIYDAFRQHSSVVRETEWLAAGNMAIRSDVFRQAGGFDASLEACEDVDLCLRLREAGFKVLSDPQMKSVHYGDPASLKALFVSEVWRGRDNVRVTLRGPLTLSSLPSMVIPIVNLLALGTIVVGPVVSRSGGPMLFGGMVLLLTIAVRAVRLFRSLSNRTPLDPIRVWLVASAYELARALALVARAPHRRAGRGEAAAAVR